MLRFVTRSRSCSAFSKPTCDLLMAGLSREFPRHCRAGDLFGLFVANLYDQQREVLGEYFEDDWSKIQPVCVEPRHQAEWGWLLKGFERITNCPTGNYRTALLASALRYGDGATGCLVDEGNADGSIRKSTRRLWPQTEIAKAW